MRNEKTKSGKQTETTTWAPERATRRKSMNGTGVKVEGIPESGTPDGIMSSEGHPRPSATRGWCSVWGGGSGSKPYRLPPPPTGSFPPTTRRSLASTWPTLRTKDPPRPSSSFCHFRYLPFLLLTRADKALAFWMPFALTVLWRVVRTCLSLFSCKNVEKKTNIKVNIKYINH